MALHTEPFDPAQYLRTPERIAAYLNSVLEDGDAAELADALETVARARELHGLSTDEAQTEQADLGSARRILSNLGLRLQVAAA